MIHANGNIGYMSKWDSEDKIHNGVNYSLMIFSEYFVTVKKIFSGPIKSEAEAHITTVLVDQ